MSNEAITWAYQQNVSTGAKFVLVALADLADEGHSCYPGQAKLATMTGQSERSVRRQLAELALAGFIRRDRRFDRAGHRTSDRYVLPVGHRIPTGQSDQRSDRPEAKPTRGHRDQRPDTTALPAKYDSPTGQDVRVSLSEPPEKNPSSDAARLDVERICKHLADRIEANGSRRPAVTERWRKSARLMLDVDQRTEEKIVKAIDWCQADEFWRSNILSLPKLREKYDQLRLAAARPVGTTASVRIAARRHDPLGSAR